MKDCERIVTDVVVVGSGAGGATLAKELAERGRDVTLVEKGRDSEWPIGKLFCLATFWDHTRMPPFLPRSKEGEFYLRAFCTGGSTTVFYGAAAYPPPWLKEKYGIDLTRETQEAIEEIGIMVPPEEFLDRWRAAGRFKEAAEEMGLTVIPELRFVDFNKCEPTCDHCVFGCEKGAKWSARQFVKKAAANGARVLVQTEVREVIIVGNHVVGVVAHGPKGPINIYADKVVLAAGGIGTPIILQRSGIKEAGSHFTLDPSGGAIGITKESWEGGGMMSYGVEETIEKEGFMISFLGPRWSSLAVFGVPLFHPSKAIKAILFPYYWKKMFGVWVKMSDDPSGQIYEDGSISKTYSKEDRQKLDKGIDLCKKIIIRAGVDPNSIIASTSFKLGAGGHPSGSAGVDRVVDRNLETRVKNLYVCDASIIPEAPGRPPALTVVALGKWLAKRL